MLVHKSGGDKDILGFRCDQCDEFTMMDVIPNEHGEFRYICPKCGHHMRELPETKEEETEMENTYTVENAAKRLNCSKATINRAIHDGRFHDCYTTTGYRGKPAWMIPSDQVEAWVTSGDFLLPPINRGKRGRRTPAPAPRMVFDPELKKNVPVLNLLGDIPIEQKDVSSGENDLNEFQKRVVRRVAKSKDDTAGKKYVKVLDRREECKAGGVQKEPIKVLERTESVMTTKDPWGAKASIPYQDEVFEVPDPMEKFLEANTLLASSACKPQFTYNDEDGTWSHNDIRKPAWHIHEANKWDENGKPIAGRYPWGKGDTDGDDVFLPIKPESTVVRTNEGFNITIPTEIVEDIVKGQVKAEISSAVNQLRVAFDLLNEELKKLEEAIA